MMGLQLMYLDHVWCGSSVGVLSVQVLEVDVVGQKEFVGIADS